jgi:hypothetical protein
MASSITVDKKIHLKDTIKQTLTTFFINYGDSDNEQELKKAMGVLEIELRTKANYYIKREQYDPSEVLNILQEIKSEKFLEEGLAGVNFRNKEIMTTRLHTLFKNLLNYITILKNWTR